jgi:AcrR family transcriptional regulator
VADSGRVYAGLTPNERLQQRRSRLLDAGLEVFASRGWASATVLEVCREAKLSQRYFYELFDTREALFLAVVDRIADQVEAAVRAAAGAPESTPAERARGVLVAIRDSLAADPRMVKVALIESLATPALRAHRAELLSRFSTLAAQLMRALHPDPERADGRQLALSAAILSGGVAEALVMTVSGHPPADQDELVEHLLALYAAAARLDASGM